MLKTVINCTHAEARFCLLNTKKDLQDIIAIFKNKVTFSSFQTGIRWAYIIYTEMTEIQKEINCPYRRRLSFCFLSRTWTKFVIMHLILCQMEFLKCVDLEKRFAFNTAYNNRLDLKGRSGKNRILCLFSLR